MINKKEKGEAKVGDLMPKLTKTKN